MASKTLPEAMELAICIRLIEYANKKYIGLNIILLYEIYFACTGSYTAIPP